ncbi:hypothetical protein LTR24_000881 [Lithohypha guttulata]|uniref:Heterokaryon incompatibility domain-containing protein n=1 Tax=Lithohypha guttulata TaxID=1690604 RepID=A0ABR0KMD3_9EURO|nr:hypothetical protein LTR24_000881 [Lithohypha guttulata]
MSRAPESQPIDRRRYGAQYCLDECRKQIRLLVVSPGSHDTIVACDIKICSLFDEGHPRYEAVSYAWSHVKGEGVILVSGDRTIVPAATEEALRNLRYLDRPRTLWLDAICIDQENTEERNQQVALMHEIYKKTTRTVVWLGKADESTVGAIDTIKLIHNQMCAETDYGKKLREVLYGQANIFQYSTTPLPEGCDFTALRSFLRRTWFGRLWVVHEVALGPCGIVYCGEHEISLIDLMRTAIWIQHKQHQLPFDLDKEDGMLNASYMSAHVDHDQGWFSADHGKKPFLADLLRYFRPFGVSEARDIVWAASGQPLPSSLTPRYQKPLREVLRDTTRVAIQESGDLWILRYVDHEVVSVSSNMPDETVPSWVPSLFRKPNQEKEPNPLRSAFRANKGLEGSHSVEGVLGSSNEDLLIANGLKLGTLNAVGPVLGNESQSIPRVQELLHRTLAQKFVQADSFAGSLSSFTTHDLVLTLVGGSTFNPSPAQKGECEPVASIFNEFVAVLDAVCQTNHPDRSDDESYTFANTLENARFARCVWAIRYACTNRRLFTTQGGQIGLGLGPQASQEGDVVCVLAGSRMPMVLRPAATGFRVVGPCYVHGIMQGEAAAMIAEGRIDQEQFVLR